MALWETSVAASGGPSRRLAGAILSARGHLFPWAPVVLAVGIGLYFAPASEPSFAVLAVAGAGLVAGFLARLLGHEILHPFANATALVSLGFLLAFSRAHTVAEPVLQFRYFGPVEGRIVAIDRSVSDALRLTLDRVVLSAVNPDRTPARVRVALHGDAAVSPPEPGARIMLTGHLAPPEGPVSPGGFNFQRLAWFDRLGAVGYSRTPVLRVEAADDGPALAALRFRMTLSRSLQAQVEGQAGALASAFLTGDRSAISVGTNEVMRASNLSHLISISGLHMALVVGFVFALVRYGIALVPALALRVNSKAVAAAIALVAATGYLILAGPDVATERAWIMAGVMLVAILARRRAVSLRSVAVAAIVLLVLAPESLTQPGFQMSFGATVALIVAFRQWQAVQEKVPVLLRPVAVLILSSVVAGLSTGPIAAAHFNRLAGYGLIANLLAVPVMGMAVMPAGVLAGLLAPFGLAALPLWVLERGTALILAIAHTVAGWEGAVRGVTTPPSWVLPAFAFGFLGIALLHGRWRMIGLFPALIAAMGWAGADRPGLLISSDGKAVAVMTDIGRSPSRPTGSGFVLTTWLEDDGDLTLPEDAFARGAFDGARGQSVGHWNGVEIVHLTGKTAPERAHAKCAAGRILVLDGVFDPTGPCEVWDLARLRETGSVAMYLDGMKVRTVTARSAEGDRIWSRHARSPGEPTGQ